MRARWRVRFRFRMIPRVMLRWLILWLLFNRLVLTMEFLDGVWMTDILSMLRGAPADGQRPGQPPI